MFPENTNNTNLFLIGMMGSWKSTVGRELSKVMDMEFVDTDDAIEEINEMEMADIFKEFGENRFRKMEKAFFIEKAKKPGQIFSTGGGGAQFFSGNIRSQAEASVGSRIRTHGDRLTHNRSSTRIGQRHRYHRLVVSVMTPTHHAGVVQGTVVVLA